MDRLAVVRVPAITVPIVGFTLSLLIGANIFFVKRLVDQLDATREIVWQLRQEVVVLKLTVDNIPVRHKLNTGG